VDDWVVILIALYLGIGLISAVIIKAIFTLYNVTTHIGLQELIYVVFLWPDAIIILKRGDKK